MIIVPKNVMKFEKIYLAYSLYILKYDILMKDR